MSFVTVVVNGLAEYAFKEDVISKIPYFAGNKANRIAVRCPEFVIDFRHLSMLAKVYDGRRIVPGVDASSHLDILNLLRFSQFLGINKEVIVDGLQNWTEHSRWVELNNPEYLFAIYAEHEELVDFGKFFRMGGAFASLAKARDLPYMRARPELYIDMLKFYKNFNFALCFEANNERIQDQVDALNKERAANSKLFLVNPHEPFLAEYFLHSPREDLQLWNCKNISCTKPLAPGEHTIVGFAEAVACFKKFTCNMLEKPLNPKVTKPFPYANVAFAGGSITKILDSKYDVKHSRQSDADIFVFAKTFDERAKIFEEIVEWFRTYNVGTTVRTYYAVRGSVMTIYIKDIARKFQVISINSKSAYEIISRFDLTHIQWMLYEGVFYGTPEACQAMREKVTRFNNTNRLKVDRMVKALYCGYSIFKDSDVMQNHVDITNLIENPQSDQMRKYIRNFSAWYYPRTDPEEDDDDTQHILAMIEVDAKATLVTNDPNFVINNITIGGNFESDYESTMFSLFNPAHIMNQAVNARIKKLALRGAHGWIRLSTPIMTVSRFIPADTGIDIRCNPNDEEFRIFCAMLENQVFALYNARGVTKHILSDNGEITFTIPKYRIEHQTSSGISCLRSHRGEPLNIEEDLRPGDKLQVLFLIEIIRMEEERFVELKGIKFVKFQTYDPEQAAKIRAVTDDIEREISIMNKNAPQDNTINYDSE